jgi:hypothetical protein
MSITCFGKIEDFSCCMWILLNFVTEETQDEAKSTFSLMSLHSKRTTVSCEPMIQNEFFDKLLNVSNWVLFGLYVVPTPSQWQFQRSIQHRSGFSESPLRRRPSKLASGSDHNSVTELTQNEENSCFSLIFPCIQKNKKYPSTNDLYKTSFLTTFLK